MNKRFLIIANPISGGGRGAASATQLREALLQLDLDADCFFTRESGDARQRAEDAAADDFSGIICVGGDGTVNEVLNGMRDMTIPLTTLAMGTANVLARVLGLPREPAALARVVANGRTMPAAVGLANGRKFLLFASCGLDASIVRRVEEVRRGRLGMIRWIPSILHVIRRWPVRRLAFTTAKGITHEDLSTVLVTRVGIYGGILHLPGKIELGDGELHVLGFRQRSRLQYLRAVIRSLCGRLRENVDVICTTTAALRISGDEAPWQIDGDLGGSGSVDVRLDEGEARLFIPESAASA